MIGPSPVNPNGEAPHVMPWVDARTDIDMSQWWANPKILALIDREIAEINDLADRIERAQAALRAYLIHQGKLPAA